MVEFTTGATNTPPAVANAVPAQSLTVGGTPFSLDLNAQPAVFSAGDGDVLSYSAISNDTSIATVALEGSVVTIGAAGDGSTTITLTATDTTTQISVLATRLAGDFDANGTVNFDDFFQFADRFASTPAAANWSSVFDLIADEVINFDDFFVFADNFGAQAN